MLGGTFGESLLAAPLAMEDAYRISGAAGITCANGSSAGRSRAGATALGTTREHGVRCDLKRLPELWLIEFQIRDRKSFQSVTERSIDNDVLRRFLHVADASDSAGWLGELSDGNAEQGA